MQSPHIIIYIWNKNFQYWLSYVKNLYNTSISDVNKWIFRAIITANVTLALKSGFSYDKMAHWGITESGGNRGAGADI